MSSYLLGGMWVTTEWSSVDLPPPEMRSEPVPSVHLPIPLSQDSEEPTHYSEFCICNCLPLKIDVLLHIHVLNILFKFTCFKFYKLDRHRLIYNIHKCLCQSALPPLKIVSSVAAYVVVHCCIVFHCVMELQILPNSLGSMPIVPRSRTVRSQGCKC